MNIFSIIKSIIWGEDIFPLLAAEYIIDPEIEEFIVLVLLCPITSNTEQRRLID